MKFALPLSLLLTTLTAFGGVVEFDSDTVEIEAREASFAEERVGDVDVVKARFEPTENWSSIRFLSTAGSWDLSKYSGVEVEITNEGSTPVRVGVRVDETDALNRQAWNSAMSPVIAPGDTKTVFVQFGRDYNNPKEIDTARIGSVLIFLEKGREEASTLVISGIRAVE